MDQTMGLVIYIAFFIGLIYLMIIRPQKKEKTRKAELMNSLKKGAAIVTYSGIHGTVTGIDSDKGIIVVSVAKGVDLTMEKAAVARVMETKEAE